MRPEQMPPLLREILAPQRRRLIALRGALGYAFLFALALALAEWTGARRVNLPGCLLYAILIPALVWFHRRNRAWDPSFRRTSEILGRTDGALRERLDTALAQEPESSSGAYSFLQTKLFRELSYRGRTHPIRLPAIGWRLAGARGIQWVFAAALLWTVSRPAEVVYSKSQLISFGAMTAQFLEVSPGSLDVEKGSNLVIIATFSNPDRVPESVDLVRVSALGQRQREPMIRNLDDPSFGFTIPEINDGFDYQVVYGNAATESFTVSVFERPQLIASRVEIHYPNYTGWEPRTLEDTRRVTAVEGSKIRVVFDVNKPLAAVTWAIEDEQPIALQASEELPQRYTYEWTLSGDVEATLNLVDDEARTNKAPLRFRFQALPNEPPSLRFLLPQGDIEVSSLEEIRFKGEAEDDWGLLRYGFGYALLGAETLEEVAGERAPKNTLVEVASLVDLERLEARERDVLTYYLWAEDYGPDDQVRRTESSLFFAEVRPFESIFREGVAQSGSQPQQQDLIQRQRDIISATWNLRRNTEATRDRLAFDENLQVIESSQRETIAGIEGLIAETDDPDLRSALEDGIGWAEGALRQLASARQQGASAPLSEAVSLETKTLSALLETEAAESQVTQSQNGQPGQAGRNNSRSQRQLNNLELSSTQDNYETERQASQAIDEGAAEETETLDALRELARRQEDFNERLQELQTALEAAEDELERQRIERELKRLRDEQRQMAQDLDDLESQMADSGTLSDQDRERLEETREQMRDVESSLEDGEVSQALAQGERARRALDTMRSEALDRASSAFSEEMRRLVDQANQVRERQDEIGQNLAERQDTPSSPGLTDTDDEQELVDLMRRQEDALNTLLESMREVTDAAETSEPLLAERLYETLRNVSQEDPAQALSSAADLTERGFLPMAEDYEEIAAEGIEGLARGIRRAAESVLGGELEGLRMARDELNELADRVREDLQANGAETPSNEPASEGGESTTDTEPGVNDGNARQARAEGDPQAGGTEGTAPAENDPAGSAPPDQPLAEGANAAPGQGSPNGGGSQPDETTEEPTGTGAGMADAADTPFFELEQFQGQEGRSGPFSGSGFLPWVRRLEDVENMIFDEELRDQVAQINEQAREIRAESRRQGTAPQWDLVDTELLTPLGELIDAIQSEIAQRDDSRALAPVDRDPVPEGFQETVRRYYERLGGIGAAPSTAESTDPNDAR